MMTDLLVVAGSGIRFVVTSNFDDGSALRSVGSALRSNIPLLRPPDGRGLRTGTVLFGTGVVARLLDFLTETRGVLSDAVNELCVAGVPGRAELIRASRRLPISPLG